MADPTGNANDDLELDSEGNTTVGQSAAVRKNISLKLKGKGRGRGRRGGRARKTSPRKGTVGQNLEEDDEGDENKPNEIDPPVSTSSETTLGLVDIDDDITKLETPTFTTLERANSEPLHQNKKLKWTHKVNLIGEKVVNPMIHCCEKCSLPILIYGRMIPCKHVFCLDCAKKFDKSCPRCREKVSRVEQSALGSVFICTYGAARHATGGCKRTYLSQRDLQAHINHRHLRQALSTSSSSGTSSSTSTSTSTSAPSFTSHPASGAQPSSHIINIRDPRNHLSHPNEGHPPMSQGSQPSHTPPPHMSLPPPSQGHLQQPPPVVHIHQHMPDYRDGVNPPGSIQGMQDQARSTNMLPPPPQHLSGPLGTSAPLLPQPPPQAGRAPHQFVHPPPGGPNHQQYPSPIPVVSTRSNLITVPIQDDNSSSPHIGHPGHPPQHMSPYAAHSPSPQSHQQQPPPPPPPPNQMQQPPPMQHPYQQPPPNHHYQNAPPPPYSQPPIGQQNFSQPPPTHLPPPPQPMHNPSPPIYSTHPPVHHPPPPPNYNPQQIRPHPMPRPLAPPQRFPGPSTYDDGHYGHNAGSWGGGPRPPPSHPPMAPRPMGGPPHGPNDQGFRPSYYP